MHAWLSIWSGGHILEVLFPLGGFGKYFRYCNEIGADTKNYIERGSGDVFRIQSEE